MFEIDFGTGKRQALSVSISTCTKEAWTPLALLLDTAGVVHAQTSLIL